MTADVVALKGGDIVNERRDAFLRAVAGSFDLYVKDHGQQPDAVVYVLGGIKQPTRTGWEVTGESQDGATSMLSLSAHHLMAEVIVSRQELP